MAFGNSWINHWTPIKSRNRRNLVRRIFHRLKNLVEPLKRSIKTYFNPTRGAGDVLAVIFSAPSFDETQTHNAHLRKLKYSFKSLTDRLIKQICEFLIIEDSEAAARRDFADGRRMESMVIVTIATLDKDATFAQALGKYLTSDIIQMNSCR